MRRLLDLVSQYIHRLEDEDREDEDRPLDEDDFIDGVRAGQRAQRRATIRYLRRISVGKDGE